MVPVSLSMPARRTSAPRWIAVLGLLALSATFFCAVVGYLMANQAWERGEQERRSGLVAAIADVRAAGTEITDLDPQFLQGLENAIGLKGLRFETEPEPGARDAQPALDGNGRIVGWFTWERHQPMVEALTGLFPFLLASAVGLVCFAGLALWQLNRGMRKLAASEQQAWKLAQEDPLTGMPNQRRMFRLIDEALVARATDELVNLAIVDIDGLNEINDAFGRRLGDQLLMAFAERLRQAAPEAGRIGDDEFVVLMSTPDSPTARELFEAMARSLTRPYWLGDQSVQISATIGVAHALHEGVDHDELLRCADLALRAAKRKSRGGILEFKPEMDAEFTERRFLERALRQAIADGAVEVHYQPVVKADGTAITGVEALARWHHPERGAILPQVFIPVAERTGLMCKLGEFVLRRALADAVHWPGIHISVNVSPVQVRDPAFVQVVTDALKESGVPATRLVLEMTEGVFIDNPEDAKQRLDALRAIGVRLALDDFGTGYSSLTYLQRFQFDTLKIDRSFVHPLGKTRGDEILVQAIVALGRALNLQVLAEGVETEAQRVLLRLAGCDEMQGFLFARPAPAESIDRLLAEATLATAQSRPILRAAGGAQRA